MYLTLKSFIKLRKIDALLSYHPHEVIHFMGIVGHKKNNKNDSTHMEGHWMHRVMHMHIQLRILS